MDSDIEKKKVANKKRLLLFSLLIAFGISTFLFWANTPYSSVGVKVLFSTISLVSIVAGVYGVYLTGIIAGCLKVQEGLNPQQIREWNPHVLL